LDLIISDKDESYKILVFRHDPPTPAGFVKCETCTFEQPNYIDTCQMCQMRHEKSVQKNYDYTYNVPDLESICLSRYSSLSAPLDSSLSASLEISQALELETNITTETSSVSNPEPNHTTSESNSVIAEYNNTPFLATYIYKNKYTEILNLIQKHDYLVSVLKDNIIKLRGSKTNIIGRGLIIHEDEDDCGQGLNTESLKTGNAGKRIACAVIGYSKQNFLF
jgi:hypothetical protein